MRIFDIIKRSPFKMTKIAQIMGREHRALRNALMLNDDPEINKDCARTLKSICRSIIKQIEIFEKDPN